MVDDGRVHSEGGRVRNERENSLWGQKTGGRDGGPRELNS